MIKGDDELPIGTHIYYVGSRNRVTYAEVQYDIEYSKNYIFDSNDGLWATKFARSRWEKYPQQHPHCTLFEILYKKLGIKER
jgi:hypothetical protein